MKFPNIEAMIRDAALGNDERLEKTIIYIIDQIAAQCHNEDRKYDYTDIDDIEMMPRYEDGQRPETLEQADDMLEYGYLLNAEWKIQKIAARYTLLYQGKSTHQVCNLEDLIVIEGLDRLLRGWYFKSY